MTRKSKATDLLGKTKKWVVAIYVRLSREDGNDENLSIKNQIDRLKDYISSNDEEFILYKVYIDDGQTGTDSDRKGFQEMLNDIYNKNVNCVIVKDLSRLSRNHVEAGQYLEYLFVEYDIRFISLELPKLDSYKEPDGMNSIIVPITNVFNEEFARQTSIKIRGTFNRKRKNGEFIGAFAPYGYLKSPQDKNSLIIDEISAPVVRDIFTWFVVDGMSKQAIAKRLNNLGIPNPMEYKHQQGHKYHNPNTDKNDTMWSPTAITIILKNQVYIGNMVQGKQRVKSYKVHTRIRTDENEWFVVENTHEPIINKEIFEKAQNLHQKNTRTLPDETHISIFSGFLKCADCQKAMTKTTIRKKIVYYFCRTYREKSKEKCTKHSIRHDVLEQVVLSAIQTQIALLSSFSDIIAMINASPHVQNQSVRLNDLLVKHSNELEKIIDVLDGLYLDWKNGDITREQYSRIKEKTEEKIQLIKARIEKVKAEQKQIENGIQHNSPYIQTFLDYQDITELNRSALVDLVSAIYIHENGEIDIAFTFADQHKLIVEYIENNRHILKLQKKNN